MRLEKYIKEELNTNYIYDVAKILQRDCKQIIKEVKRAGDFLYRGTTEKKFDGLISKPITPRKNRKAAYISNKLHTMMDDVLYQIFGWAPRSEGLFCGNRGITQSFGNKVHLVFPIGNFKYIWNNVDDLWNDFFDTKHDPYYDDEDEAPSELVDELEKYKDKNLYKCLDPKRFNDRMECIVNCKSYYLVVNNEGTRDTLLKVF